MFKKLFLCLAVAVFLGMGLIGTVAAVDSPDKVTIYNEDVFGKTKKGPVEFSHNKHNKDYGVACAECHHNDKYDGKTNNWKEGDAVQKCSECHKKNKEGKLDKLQNAFHKNCKNCHKEAKKGPYKKCAECHADK